MGDGEARPITGTDQDEPYVPVIGNATQGLGEYLVREGKLSGSDAFHRVREEGIQIVKRCKPFDDKPGTETGLVVGYVQSGKTMSMTTVASLARDNGCRIVILLAGVTTNLLRQNASRFRETLRAAAGGREHWLIINSEDGKNRTSDGQLLRQAVSEWRDGGFDPDDQRCLFFAVLKNHAHLAWLASVLVNEKLADIPALILDDEADQASLNVGGPDEPSRTYTRIAEIRERLPNHTYLQYTATPQAPLLISIDDMLSPAFAELVSPGDEYTGGQEFFPERQVHPHVIEIPEADLFKAGELPLEPPGSLLQALATFFVCCAIARQQGTPKTRSMLIHPSQLNSDQQRFIEWVQQTQKRWLTALSEGKGPKFDVARRELETGYIDLSRTAKELPAFDLLLPHLKLSLSRALTHKVNSEEVSGVDWDNGGDHILVGGEKLNRGYTVEGLLTTYMPRDAGGWNADTIQQRARFFGYKRKYMNLCRIYLHPDVHNAYRSYVVHERDVRRQLGEHRGRPLREWRRAFFLDARMKPTRMAVLSDPLFRVKRDKFWFKQSYPHVDEGNRSIDQNTRLVEAFMATLALGESEKSSQFRGRKVARTALGHALTDLLLDFKIAYETVTWYAHLVTLSDLNTRCPIRPVTVVLVDNNGKARVRNTTKSNQAIQLFQGRSSADGGQGGDDKMISASEITLQIHRLSVDDKALYAIAVHVPKKDEDALARGNAK